jgi:hypothetical protein
MHDQFADDPPPTPSCGGVGNAPFAVCTGLVVREGKFVLL